MCSFTLTFTASFPFIFLIMIFKRNLKSPINLIILLQILIFLDLNTSPQLYSSYNNSLKTSISYSNIITYALTLNIKLPKKCFNSYQLYRSRNRNRIMHSYYGNRRKTHGYTIMHINKGISYFNTKLSDIQLCLQTNNPDILHIAEANYNFNISCVNSDFPHYEIIQSDLSEHIGYSRNIIMIKKDIKYKRRRDLESYPLSSIWIEIFPPRTKSILLNGYYRQWDLPRSIRTSSSGSNSDQNLRYDEYSTLWTKAMTENRDTVIIGDDNIDTFKPDLNTMTSHNKKLYLKLTDMLEDTSMVISNYEPTFGIKKENYSTIDHIYNNCPKKLINVSTLDCNFSDHQMLRFKYLTKAQIIKPRFKNIRNLNLLNNKTLNLHLKQSQELNTVFSMTNPNLIANTLQDELTLIINTIAPQKRIQVKNIHSNFLTPGIVKKIKENHTLLTTAINSKKMKIG